MWTKIRMGLLNTQNETTALLFPVSHLVRYCTKPEVKSDALIHLECGEEKLRSFFSIFIQEQR